MKYVLKAKTHSLKGTVKLPASKSISNRVLIIQALAEHPFQIKNLSKAKDTEAMLSALEKNDIITDVGPAGTAMRFLTAYYAGIPGEKVLTGSDRMKNRPISTLVDALNELGAKITYLENEGFPPLHIEGRKLHGGKVKVAGNISSQFLTALMLIGPTLPEPLDIEIEGDPLSRPYIVMTQKLMEQCGAQVEYSGNHIIVKPGRYRSHDIEIEQDWSAAAFWMSFVSLSRKAELTLENLKPNSLQGDSESIKVFELLGVKSTFTEHGLLLQKQDLPSNTSSWNFRDHPDLVQPAAFSAAMQKLNFTFSGLDNLRLKETDRVAAIEQELIKVGIEAQTKGHTLSIIGGQYTLPTSFFEAYEDHRMVMSVAPLSMVFNELLINDPLVVNKSYPGFWKEVERFVDVRPSR